MNDKHSLSPFEAKFFAGLIEFTKATSTTSTACPCNESPKDLEHNTERIQALPINSSTETQSSCFRVFNGCDESKDANNNRREALRKILKESKKQFLQGFKPNTPRSMQSANLLCKCNCKKSGCLKMYCECFRRKGYCDSCNCIGCMNKIECEPMRQQAMQLIKEKNPFAFEEIIVVQKKENTENDNLQVPHHIKGCKCKKTNCKKKYCECFQMGVQCGPDCQCTGCLNDKISTTNISQSTENEPIRKQKKILEEYSQSQLNSISNLNEHCLYY